MTATYEGRERRRRPRPDPAATVPPTPPMSRRSLIAVLAIAWLAIMVPVTASLVFSVRSDERAERAGRTVCELATGLNGALALLDPENRRIAEEALGDPLERAVEFDAETGSKCLPGVGQPSERSRVDAPG